MMSGHGGVKKDSRLGSDRVLDIVEPSAVRESFRDSRPRLVGHLNEVLQVTWIHCEGDPEAAWNKEKIEVRCTSEESAKVCEVRMLEGWKAQKQEKTDRRGA